MDFSYFEIQGDYHGMSISLGDKNLPNTISVSVSFSSPVCSASFTVLCRSCISIQMNLEAEVVSGACSDESPQRVYIMCGGRRGF